MKAGVFMGAEALTGQEYCGTGVLCAWGSVGVQERQLHGALLHGRV